MKLPEFEIKIGDMTYENTFEDDIVPDRTNLEEEFARQPQIYAYYAFLSEMAKHKHMHLKHELERLYGIIDHEKRKTAEAHRMADPKFKYTEKMCENEVLTDPRYVAKKNALLDASLTAGILAQAREAVAQRHGMLIQMGANFRVGEHQPARILEQQQEKAKEVIAQSQAKEQPKPRRTPKSQ